MISPNIFVTDDNNFNEEVLEDSVPVMIYFSATWCGVCKAQNRMIDKIADDYAGSIKVFNLDIDESPKTTRKFGVRSVPTMIVYRDERKYQNIIGLTDHEKLVRLIGLQPPLGLRAFQHQHKPTFLLRGAGLC